MENMSYKENLKFFNNLKEDIAQCLEKGHTIKAFLKNQYGITNVMDYEFEDLKDKDCKDYNFENVRGNVQLMAGNIRTSKESEELIDEVIAYDYSALLSYKP